MDGQKSGWCRNERHGKEQKRIIPNQFRSGMGQLVEEGVMVQPHNRHYNIAQGISPNFGHKRSKGIPHIGIGKMGSQIRGFEVKNHDRNDNGYDTIREGFDAVFAHHTFRINIRFQVLLLRVSLPLLNFRANRVRWYCRCTLAAHR